MIAALVLLGASACEHPDTSFKTSPSVRTLLGTTTGYVVLNPPEQPPATKDPANGWRAELGLAMFTRLDNGTPAIQVVMDLRAQPGAGMEIWLAKQGGQPVAHWSAGTTRTYGGTVCFQLATQENGEMLPLDPPSPYEMTVAFLDPNGNILASSASRVTGLTPHLQGTPPAAGSKVFSLAYACPQGN